MRLPLQAQAVFDQYRERSAREMALQKQLSSDNESINRDDLLLPVGEDVAGLLHTLAVSKGATRILELGTSYGYSTLILADAARLTGGRVITLDTEAHKQTHAREALARAGLDSHVEFVTGNALALLPALEGPFDLVLLDLWKELYIPCLELFLPKLADGAIVVADNMLIPPFHRTNAQRYQQHVRSRPEIIQSQEIPIGWGIELSCFHTGGGMGS